MNVPLVDESNKTKFLDPREKYSLFREKRSLSSSQKEKCYQYHCYHDYGN